MSMGIQANQTHLSMDHNFLRIMRAFMIAEYCQRLSIKLVDFLAIRCLHLNWNNISKILLEAFSQKDTM